MTGRCWRSAGVPPEQERGQGASFFAAEIDYLNNATAPVWLAGLTAFAVWRRFRDLQVFAIAFVVLIAAMIAMHGKPYYPAGAYPILFAGGAVVLEARIAWRSALSTFVALVARHGALAASFAMPILPLERFAAYQDILGRAPTPIETSPLGHLPQYYADMFGWPQLVALVGQASQSLPPEERAVAVFFGNNDGEAAAVEDVLGKACGLPPAISARNSYFLWGLSA
jgi:hypothetical protein